MTDEDSLRDAFADAVPTPPSVPDRAAGARGLARRTRRRRAAGSVLAAAVAVAAVAVLPGLLDGAPGPSAPSSPASPDALVCPAVRADVAQDGPTEIGDDVVGARLCSGPSSGFVAPDVVIGAGDAADIADQVDRLDPLPPGTECTQEADRPYVIVFALADGSAQPVHGAVGGCDVVTVGGLQRQGADGILETTLATARGAEATLADPTCPTGGPLEVPTGPSEVAPGPVVVRLCQGPGLPIHAPVDALRTDVDDLVELVNSAPLREGTLCRLDLGLGYSLVFGYPDGTTQTITGELRGCRAITVGGVMREDAERVLDAFVDLLHVQREPLDAANDAPEPACPGDEEGESVVGEVTEMTDAVLCFQYASDRPMPDRSVSVTRAELQVLLADLDQEGSRERPMGGCGFPPAVSLIGTTAWGDRVVLRGYCGGTWIVGDTYVPLSSEAFEILDRLQTEVGGDPPPRVTAETSPEALVPAYVDLHNLGWDDEALALWLEPDDADIAPPGTRIGFELLDAVPVGVKAWSDAAAVTGSYREGDGEALEVTFVVVRESPDEPYRILRRE